MIPGGEYWKTCQYLALRGFLCILSAEDTGQYGTGNNDPTSDGLGRRGLAMWRTLYALENNDPESPFFGRVCPKACSMGYSMGGGAAQNVAYDKYQSFLIERPTKFTAISLESDWDSLSRLLTLF